MKTSRYGVWHIITLLVLLSMILTACATPTPATVIVKETVPVTVKETVQVQVTSVVEKKVEVTSTPAPATGVVLNKNVSGTVELWHFWASPVRRNAIRRVVAMCQTQLPNIKVNDTVKPFGDIWTANVAAVAAGSGMPDVIVEDRPKLPQLAADGIESDLQALIDRDKVDSKVFYPFTWNQTLYQGHSYGIPFETDVRIMFYNKTMFTDEGLDPEKPPKTWDDLWALADKLDKKDANGNYTRMAFFPLFGNTSIDMWKYTQGVEWVDANGNPKVNDEKTLATVQWIKKWVDRYGGWQKINDFKAKFGAAPNDLFMAGAVGMYVDVAGYNSQLEFYRPTYALKDGKSKPRVDWGAAEIPYAVKPASWSGGFALSIPKGAKNAAAAWEFIKCATSYEANVSWSRDTYAIATYEKANADPQMQAIPIWSTISAAMKNSTGGVFVPKYPNFSEQLDQRQEKVWKGEMDPKAFLDEAQKAIEDTIAKKK
jgi:multiple sugar transport system substrate-binding protein